MVRRSSMLSPSERKAMIHCTRKSGLFSVRTLRSPTLAGNELEEKVIEGATPSGCNTLVWDLAPR